MTQWTGLGTTQRVAAEDLTAGKNVTFNITLDTANAGYDWVCHEAWLEYLPKIA